MAYFFICEIILTKAPNEHITRYSVQSNSSNSSFFNKISPGISYYMFFLFPFSRIIMQKITKLKTEANSKKWLTLKMLISVKALIVPLIKSTT